MTSLFAASGLALLYTLSVVGCSTTGPRSTRMQPADFDAMISEMADSFARSNALAARTTDSPRWVISIDKVLNLSSDVMSDAEQWAIMARLRGAMPIAALWDQKNIRFVIPPQRVRQLRDNPDIEALGASFGAQRQVTHLMTATFRSLTRATATQRSELYYCEFEILDVAGGEPVWTDKFEYKRMARGHVWD